MSVIDYRTAPDRYRHWSLEVTDKVAVLTLDVDEQAGLGDDYTLKLNSYDLGVDIELADAVQRLRFEQPSVRVVIMRSGKPRVFSAGANIGMLSNATHSDKVNFCKFTNETRNHIEDASMCSNQRYLCAVEGPAAGGGYELALATDHIVLVDDGSSSVSLPEVPLLAVLPGTGGLTRLVDKRHVRRDRADVFCTLEEGVRGQRALDWGLIDELAPASRFQQCIDERVASMLDACTGKTAAKGIEWTPLERSIEDDAVTYSCVSAKLKPDAGRVEILLRGPGAPAPADSEALHALGCHFWPLRLARELDDLILHLRSNEPELGTWVFRTESGAYPVGDFDRFLIDTQSFWLAREVIDLWKRVLKRLEVTSRSLVALVTPGSCFTGTLFELVVLADQSFMLNGPFEELSSEEAMVCLTDMNLGPLPGVNGQTRLETRFLADSAALSNVHEHVHEPLDANAADALGLVTATPDDIDWDDEVRLSLEARASFSPDALTAMEANLRFAGPETLESKIFARLSAWQNWVFQRPNAVGESGALTRYGTGQQAEFDKRRV